MSSINRVSNAYSQIYSVQSSQTSAAHGKHHHQKSNANMAISDQLSISSEGMAALEKERTQHQRVNPLDSLVESGTITEDQKKAIEEAFKAAHEREGGDSSSIEGIKGQRPDGPPPGGRPPGPPPSQPLSSEQTDSVLSSLTSNGTITEEQKTAIQKALQEMIDALGETE